MEELSRTLHRTISVSFPFQPHSKQKPLPLLVSIPRIAVLQRDLHSSEGKVLLIWERDADTVCRIISVSALPGELAGWVMRANCSVSLTTEPNQSEHGAVWRTAGLWQRIRPFAALGKITPRLVGWASQEPWAVSLTTRTRHLWRGQPLSPSSISCSLTVTGTSSPHRMMPPPLSLYLPRNGRLGTVRSLPDDDSTGPLSLSVCFVVRPTPTCACLAQNPTCLQWRYCRELLVC